MVRLTDRTQWSFAGPVSRSAPRASRLGLAALSTAVVGWSITNLTCPRSRSCEDGFVFYRLWLGALVRALSMGKASERPSVLQQSARRAVQLNVSVVLRAEDDERRRRAGDRRAPAGADPLAVSPGRCSRTDHPFSLVWTGVVLVVVGGSGAHVEPRDGLAFRARCCGQRISCMSKRTVRESGRSRRSSA